MAVEVLDAGLPAGVRGVFTTRAGGVSTSPWDRLNLALHVGDDAAIVAENRARLAGLLGVDGLHFAEQVHGSGVAVITAGTAVPSPTDRGHPGVDALVTTAADVPIGVLVADCMPVVLADQAHGVIGAAHAGRRGLAGGVLQNTVAAMVELGAEPTRIRAVVGPSVCGRCYEVPAEMQAEIDAAVPGIATTTRRGTPALDLAKGAVSVLETIGVGHVRTLGICTVEDPRFFSYRRDERTGRFAGVVMLDGHG